MPTGTSPVHEAWTELRFVDLARIRKEEIARAHDEILQNAGFNFSDPGQPD